jgi:LacI family transcriptional regulator
VFASDSRVALGVLKAIRGADLAVPQEMSMVAFDDADWTSVVTPPISVVAQPTHALGRRSAEMLLRRIAGSDEPTTVDMMTTEFIARGSVAPPPDGSGVTPAG